MKLRILIPIIIFTAVLVIVGINVMHHVDENRLSYRFGVDCESNPNPVFTHYPTDMTKVQLLNPPLMRVSSGLKGHSYINVTERVPVYAPADALLVEGAKYRENLGGRGHLDQYILNFVMSCEVFYFFDHLINPPEKIAKAFAGPASNTTHSKKIEPIEIKAGEFLGYSSGKGWHNFDFGVVNMSQETSLAGDPMYNQSEKYAHADCPYKYFTPDKREVLLKLTGYDDVADLEIIDNLCAQYKKEYY